MSIVKSRIEICGNIASGKTTLSRAFATVGYTAIQEKFLRNPFIEKFYQDPDYYSFETEISFLLQHYHSIKCQEDTRLCLCDYCFDLDKAYADVTLAEHRRNLFLAIADEIAQEIGGPKLIIYLKCPEQILLNRIRTRGRAFEKPIEIGYLEELSKAIELRIANVSSFIPVLEINSGLIDFRTSVASLPKLTSILQALNE